MRHSIRVRLLAALLAIALGAAVGVSLYSLSELESYALRKLEERLESEARVVAALLAAVPEAGGAVVPADWLERPATRLVLERALTGAGRDVSSRLLLVDASGEAVADSGGLGVDAGEASRGRPEIQEALAGRYGASTFVNEDGRVVLQVAVPLRVEGAIVGAVRASASTFSIRTLIRSYRGRLLLLLAAFIAVVLVVTEMIARWLARPLAALEDGAVAFSSGRLGARVSESGARETRAVARAFNQMADEVERMVDELKEEERRKSRFVSDVSHELRTPLTAIRGAAETLMQVDVPDEERKRFLDNIVHEADRLARMAENLLVLERMEGGTGELALGPVDLAAVAERTAAAMAPALSPAGTEVSIVGAAPPVVGDPDRLQQVLANLIDNAARAAGPGGRVVVELDRDGGSAVLRVTDDGPGIPAEALPHVFERFYRSEASRDRASGGAGLGLSIAQAIVRAHGGTVCAANGPEGGALVTVRLPAA